jgi:hypothetical protein
MKRQRDSLAKILLLQEKLHKLSAWRVAALDRQRIELAAAQQDTIAAIDQDVMSHRLLLESATRRLRLIGNLIELNKLQHAAQTKHSLEQGARAKVVERMVDRVDEKYRKQVERNDLTDLIERALNRPSASSA